MLEKVRKYILDNKLLSEKDKVLVALSGGADSVCLLLILQELGYDIVAAHCNFHLRGKESDRDEQFVANLCSKRDIRLHITHFDTITYAKEHGQSIEMAARELRYTYFNTLMAEERCNAVCVAHHSDDSIETMLINLMRGTGIKGLCGIQPRNGKVVRPLLCCSRNEILHFLEDRRQAYVTDSTNLETDYVRNKIRLNLIPLMQSIAPSAKESMLTTIDNLNEEAKIYGWCMKRMEEESSYVDGEGTLHISKEGLQRSPSPLSLLHESLRGCGFNRTQLKQILSCINSTGRRFFSQHFQLTVDREDLVVTGRTEEPEEELMIEFDGTEGTIPLPHGIELEFKVLHNENISISKDPSFAYLDLKKLGSPIVVRPTKNGDAFIPFGMKGRKLVSDLLTDIKMPAQNKQRQMVLTAAEKIAWVIGIRPSNEFRITPSTDLILQLHIKN